MTMTRMTTNLLSKVASPRTVTTRMTPPPPYIVGAGVQLQCFSSLQQQRQQQTPMAPLFIKGIGKDRYTIVQELTRPVVQVGGTICSEYSCGQQIWSHHQQQQQSSSGGASSNNDNEQKFSFTMLIEIPRENIRDLMKKLHSTAHHLHPTVYDAKGGRVEL